MILQALADYYERKRAVDPDATPEWGFEHREIPFVIVLSQEGEFLNIEDTRDAGAGKKKGKKIPGSRGRGNGRVARSAPTSYGISPTTRWDSSRRSKKAGACVETASGVPSGGSRKGLRCGP